MERDGKEGREVEEGYCIPLFLCLTLLFVCVSSLL